MTPPTASWIPLGLRSFFNAALTQPGLLYQPILVENLPSGDSLIGAVEELAEIHRLKIVRTFNEVANLAFGEFAVLVISLDEAVAWCTEWSPDWVHWVPEGVQVIVWSRRKTGELPAELTTWLKTGARYTLSRSVRAQRGDDAFTGILEQTSSDLGRRCNPLVLIANAEDHARISFEVGIWFEREGVDHVLELDGPFSVDVWGSREIPRRNTVTLSTIRDYNLDPARDVPFRHALDAAVSVPAQVVLIIDPATQRVMDSSRDWASFLRTGIALNLTEAKDEVVETVHEADDSLWPPLSQMLSGKPFRGERAQVTLEGSFGAVSFGDVLQLVGNGRHTGRLLVFSDSEFGTVDFQKGRVIHVGPGSRWVPLLDAADRRQVRLDDPEARESLATRLLEDRACGMAEWEGARFLFLARHPNPPLEETVSMSTQHLALEIARRTDEWPRLRHATGGLGRVWRRIGNTPPADVASEYPLALPLWNALDGVRALGAVAESEALTDYEALLAIDALTKSGSVAAVEDVQWAKTGTPGHVLRSLWAEGLVAEVRQIMTGIQPNGDGEVEYLRAWAYVDDGRLAEARDAFHRAAKNLSGSAATFASVNALLVDLRIGATDVVDALDVVESSGWFDLALGSQVEYRSLAIPLSEIAVRAGNKERALAFFQFLPSEEILQRLTEALAQICAE